MNTICFCFSLASFLQLTIARSVQGEETRKKGEKKNKKQAVAIALSSLSCGSCSPAAVCAGLKLQLSAGGTQTPRKQMGQGEQFEGGKKKKTKPKQNVHCEATTLGSIQLSFQLKAQGSPAFPARFCWTPQSSGKNSRSLGELLCAPSRPPAGTQADAYLYTSRNGCSI